MLNLEHDLSIKICINIQSLAAFPTIPAFVAANGPDLYHFAIEPWPEDLPDEPPWNLAKKF
ncbi:MAG: hypothetical protein R3C11_01325 [Planctomycetaceae bacterium]